MNDWNEVVSGLEDGEAIKRKELEAAELAKKKSDMERQVALKEVELLKNQVSSLFDKMEALADKYNFSFSYYTPDETLISYTPNDHPDVEEDFLTPGWTNSSSSC